MKKKKNYFQGGFKGFFAALIIFLGFMGILVWLTDYTNQIENMSYTEFVTRVQKGEVAEVRVSGHDVYGTLMKNGEHFQTVIPDDQSLWSILRTSKVDVRVDSGSAPLTLWYVLPFLSFLLTLIMLWYFLRQVRGSSGGGGGANIFNLGRSKAKLFMPSTVKVKFSSVAGATEAKEELEDIVDFLKSPEKYRRIGAKMTRGILIVGEPGNGKTLLAKAVAGEANCPFFYVSGSDFIEVFVGVGAARVRNLFEEARKCSPCIIFIDEIDAVGRSRGERSFGGGNDEREQTLNQLLTELDGFQTVGGAVIVLAATNRPDVLDKALVRAGRFDRRVDVPYPDISSREKILKIHAETVKLSVDVDFTKIARGTPGFTGADLANIVNEAAIDAIRRNQEQVEIQNFEEARDKIILGKELKTIVLTQKDKELVAYHESGHTIITLLNPEHVDPLHKVTIIPRGGGALGVTHSLPEREKYLKTKEELIAEIDICVGGRAAEELIFGSITNGASSDFRRATSIARYLMTGLGMDADVGLAVYYKYEDGSLVCSEKKAEQIDMAVNALLADRYKKVLAQLDENRDKLKLLAEKLLEKETLFASEVYELLGVVPREEHTF
ncbi:MAG: ATP-dependent zinc metalloprotease FtsH [Candidatus Babeliales bacterium]